MPAEWERRERALEVRERLACALVQADFNLGASANARMYFRLRGEKPFISGKAA